MGASGDETDTEFTDQPGEMPTNPVAALKEISSRATAARKRLKAAGKHLDEVAESDAELAAKTMERYTRERRSDAEDPESSSGRHHQQYHRQPTCSANTTVLSRYRCRLLWYGPAQVISRSCGRGVGKYTCRTGNRDARYCPTRVTR
jgi:hypothetical protein